MEDTETKQCSSCDGSGMRLNKICPDCKGGGEISTCTMCGNDLVNCECSVLED